jgi:hypothetical protein
MNVIRDLNESLNEWRISAERKLPTCVGKFIVGTEKAMVGGVNTISASCTGKILGKSCAVIAAVVESGVLEIVHPLEAIERVVRMALNFVGATWNCILGNYVGMKIENVSYEDCFGHLLLTVRNVIHLAYNVTASPVRAVSQSVLGLRDHTKFGSVHEKWVCNADKFGKSEAPVTPEKLTTIEGDVDADAEMKTAEMQTEDSPVAAEY